MERQRMHASRGARATRDHESSRHFPRLLSNRQMKIVRMTNMSDVSKQAVESAQLQGQVSSFKDVIVSPNNAKITMPYPKIMCSHNLKNHCRSTLCHHECIVLSMQ